MLRRFRERVALKLAPWLIKPPSGGIWIDSWTATTPVTLTWKETA